VETKGIKEDARRLVEKLSENATWDDLMEEVYVRQAIEAGLADSRAGRTKDIKDVRASRVAAKSSAP
jgi:predicted transcriptional regulator